MNLINFHVVEIISKEKSKLWELFGMTNERFERRKKENEHLSHDGIKQTYKYWDDAGRVTVGEEIFDLTKGEKPYYAGYVGQH